MASVPTIAIVQTELRQPRQSISIIHHFTPRSLFKSKNLHEVALPLTLVENISYHAVSTMSKLKPVLMSLGNPLSTHPTAQPRNPATPECNHPNEFPWIHNKKNRKKQTPKATPDLSNVKLGRRDISFEDELRCGRHNVDLMPC